MVLAVYIATLAPTLTFWDPGELIAAARTLGIPHPPGSPLYVLLAHAWGQLIPFGNYAWRINLLNAVAGALAAGLWMLIAHDIIARVFVELDQRTRSVIAILGGVAAAVLSAFAYTTWRNATESEVYAGAALIVALTVWCAVQWRRGREGLQLEGGPTNARRPERWLVAAIGLSALAVGYHLLGLLGVPAVVAMVCVATRRRHGVDVRAAEPVALLVVSGCWLLLVGVGLARVPPLVVAGAALFVAVIVAWKGRRQQRAVSLRMLGVGLVVTCIGASTLLFLYLRAHQHPWLNEGDPGAWHTFVDVIRRAAYPPRGMFDDPTVAHGAANPGRSVTLLGYQLANYVQYLDWQWAASFGRLGWPSVPRLLVTLVMVGIGVRGAFAHRRGDSVSFALIGMLWLVTGPGLVWYLNFKPGASIGWNLWLNAGAHEVRERDYFFVVSFSAWCVWVAIGLADMARSLARRMRPRRRQLACGVFVVGLLPLGLNARAADRRHGADATLAHDYAHALLQSVPAKGILFTAGDNDTYPLWFAQQVEGFRRDVLVYCLAMHPPAALAVTQVLHRNAGVRPVAWSTSAGDALGGREALVVQRGLVYVIRPDAMDSTVPFADSMTAVDLDEAATRRLTARWDFGVLDRVGGGGRTLDPDEQVIARLIAQPMLRLASAAWERGDSADARRWRGRAIRIGGE